MTRLIGTSVDVTRRTEEFFAADPDQLRGLLCIVFGWAKGMTLTDYGNGQLADQFMRERMQSLEGVPAEAHSTETTFDDSDKGNLSAVSPIQEVFDAFHALREPPWNEHEVKMARLYRAIEALRDATDNG